MERILVLVDSSGLQRETMDFACYLANLTKSKLTGLFLTPIQEEAISFFPDSSENLVETEKRMAINLTESKVAFTRFCDNHQLSCKPDVIEAKNLNDVYVQSRFADLIVLTPNYGASTEQDLYIANNLTSILKHAECPVFIAPLTCKHPSEIVFTYDGSASSVYAIKQFTHLFPELTDLEATVLEVRSDDSRIVDFESNLLEYLKAHYRYIDIKVLKGKPEDEIFSYFIDKKETYVVMGSFGKHLMHSVFHRSTAGLLLKTTSLPVFISHK